MFREGSYQPSELRRNRRVVAGLTALGVIFSLVAGVVTSWPLANAIGIAVVVLVFGAALWWALCSRKAGPLEVEAGGWERLRSTFFLQKK